MKTTVQEFINAEMKRRTDLVESAEWNENKVAILMLMANEFCKIENTLN
jgi:hypothetical protein